MTTPAERLIAAAELLEGRASEATEGPWVTWPGPTASLVCTSVNHCTCGGGLDGYGHEPGCGLEEPPGVSAPREADARYIATVHPGVAKALALWLLGEAHATQRGEGRGFGGADLHLAHPHALALADLLLAGEQ
jgi:hypothetical protein